MPSFYNLPQSFGNQDSQPNDLYSQLPFYLVMNEVAQFPYWNIFDQLFGDIDWQSNEGDIMKGVTPERSPVGRSLFFPNNLSEVPKKDIYEVTQSEQTARVKVHNYESYQFNFYPNFVVFWKNFLKFADKDIVRQIACSNNQFIETQLWFLSPNVWAAGTGLVTGVPNLMGNVTLDAAGSKTAAWLVAFTNTYVKTGFTLRNAFDAIMALQNDLASPAFEGAKNMPTDNAGLKNRYVIVTSNEAFLNWTYDPDVLNKLNGLAPCDLNLLFNDFKGLLFGTAITKIHSYAMRFNTVDIADGGGNVLWAAGTFIDPEIYNATTKEWLPNPYYVSLQSAPYEVGHFLGDSVGKSIKVGPPPKEFATTDMSNEKFYSLKWNGEVRLTDQVLVQYADNSYDLNHYGEQLKFISKCTHGWLPGKPRYAFPIIFRRTRPVLIAA